MDSYVQQDEWWVVDILKLYTSGVHKLYYYYKINVKPSTFHDHKLLLVATYTWEARFALSFSFPQNRSFKFEKVTNWIAVSTPFSKRKGIKGIY